MRPDGSGRLLGFGDLVWRIERRGEPPIKVIGEYQGEAFHSSTEQRHRDAGRRRGLEDDDWVVEEIWRADMSGEASRRELALRVAQSLEVDSTVLHLDGVGPRFFSQFAIDQAIQRGMSR